MSVGVVLGRSLTNTAYYSSAFAFFLSCIHLARPVRGSTSIVLYDTNFTVLSAMIVGTKFLY